MEEKILFVDDEQNVLTAIKRMLFDEPYEQLYASSGEEALALIARHPVGVIISDMRMPVMDGVSLLEKSCEILPDAVRIILSGQSDMFSVMQAINRGGIWRFISKPWNDDDMKCTIRNALDLYAVRRERLRLLEELAQKNRQLESVNSELERRVLQRTALIEAQKRLLHQMIDGMDLPSFALASCKVIAELTESRQVAMLHAVGEQTHVHAHEPPSDAQRTLLIRVLSDGRETNENGYVAVPVIHSAAVLGALGVGSTSAVSAERVNETLTSILPVVALALGQFKMIMEAPNLMRTLDDIIDKL
ncbi:MAG: response regulator [Chitinispirillaceae bacterium]|nr:response regulator [Chitinispirillaceae bacterium]